MSNKKIEETLGRPIVHRESYEYKLSPPKPSNNKWKTKKSGNTIPVPDRYKKSKG